ncbi:MAG: DUF3857 domain-containing transglutaminase family protein [Gemmatimonadaceae bacterium]
MRLALLLIPTVASAAFAQAPKITPAGDPSIKSDTIYRLAVNPQDHPEEPFVYLLDDGVVRFEADGRASRTYRQVVQILTREAAEQWGEQTFYFSAKREKLTLNWMRVVKPNGELVRDKPEHEQESLAPVGQSAPVYTDQRMRRVSMGGIEPGTILDFSYTTEIVDPVMAGDFASSWSVTTGRLTRRSRLILDVPAALTPRLEERNLTIRRRTIEKNGRRVYTWTASDVQKEEGEPFAADSNSVYQGISIYAPVEWATIAKWYAGLSADRYALTPAIEKELSFIVKNAKTQDDSLRATYRWVAQDFRYVSLSLGIDGYQPRYPAIVLETKYGDCKDKATLFIALARRMGLKAHPVLLSSGGGIDRRFPSISQFDHMIAAVERGKSYLFLDLTAELTPFNTLPPSLQGEFGLLVHEDGRGEEVTFPAEPLTANRSVLRIVGELSSTGAFTGRYEETASGTEQYSLRGAFTEKMSVKEQERLALSIANGVFEGASGDSLVLFDGRDLAAEPRVTMRVRAARAISDAGGTMILTLPIRNYASQGLVANLESREKRRFPIDVGEVIGPVETVSEFRVTLPAGWRARLPEKVNAVSEFGSYSADYSQSGREVVVARRLSGRSGTEPPEKIGALIGWLKEVSKDDVKYIVIERK